MPRRARMYLPGYAYHVVQRGNNRENCFISADDYQLYLDLWRRCAKRYKVNVHAYCLMTNHIHFLVTPANETGLSNTMKVVGSRYAFYINRRYERTGTLWEGRHRSSLVQSAQYLLSCYRYIELNPVRARIVRYPEEYKWSSYGYNGLGSPSWLMHHPDYLHLGTTASERCKNYRALISQKLDTSEIQMIRKAAHYNQPVAERAFRQQIEKTYGVKFGYMNRGRPKQKAS